MSSGSLAREHLTSRRPWALASAAAAVAALTALGAVLRFYGLGHQGLWFDEANTALLVRFSPGKMLGLIPQTESTPPLYYCVAWVWVRLFGSHAAGLRSLSAVAGVLLIPIAYATAAELAGRRAGIICAALAACNPLLVWYSQEARSYQLLVALTGLSLLAFARAWHDPTPRRAALWAVACVAALATHYFAGLLVVPEAVAMLVAHRRRRPVVIAVAVLAACAAGLAVLAISQNGTGNDAWIAHTSLTLRLSQVVPQFLIGTDAPARDALWLAALALSLVGLLGLAWAQPRRRRRALLTGGLAVTGFAIALVLIVLGFDDLITRNVIALWLPAAIAVSVGLAALRRPVAVVATTALCAIGVTAVVAVATDARMQRPDWPGVARAIGDEPAPGQARAILIQRFGTLLPLSLYLPGLHRLRGPVRVSQLDVISMRSPHQTLCWWGAECNLIPSRMQRSYPIPGLRTVGVRHVRQFTIKELGARRPRVLTRAEVAAALTKTRLSHDILMVQRRA